VPSTPADGDEDDDEVSVCAHAKGGTIAAMLTSSVRIALSADSMCPLGIAVTPMIAGLVFKRYESRIGFN
jgi:hypothetical protein